MPWNFGGNPDNPNSFDPEGMAYEGGNPDFDETVPPGFNMPPGNEFTDTEYPVQGGPFIPGVDDPVPPGFNTPPGGGGFDLGGFDLGKFLQGLPKGILDMMPGSDGKSIAAGLMIPSWLSAYKQWQDAGKYSETAKEAAKYGDPFGQANREYYQGQLKNSYEHPEMFLNDPGHQAKLKSGLDQVSRQDAMKGYLGSGNMAADLSAYTANLNNQFLDQERARLMGLTGAQFNPAAAGEFLMKGNEQEIASQNAALQALMYPFMMNMGENHITNNTNNGGGGGNQPGTTKPGAIDYGKYGTTPQQIQQEILAASKGMGGTAADLIKAVLSNPFANVSASTRAILQEISANPNGMKEFENLFPETGQNTNVDWAGNPIIDPRGVDYPNRDYEYWLATGRWPDRALGIEPEGPPDDPVHPIFQDDGDLPISSVDYGPGLDFEIPDSEFMIRDMPVFDFEEPSTFDFTGD